MNPSKYGTEEQLELTSFNLTNSHERDARLKFWPEPHIYTFDDVEMTPVSTVIATWFPTFDAESNAERKATPDHPKQQYIEEWACNSCRARAAGTFMHDQIERTLLGKSLSDSHKFQFSGEYVRADEQIAITREMASFRRFLEEVKPQPYRTEWRICDEQHRIAGTIDFLTRTADGSFIMYDWKRSNKLIDPYNHQVIDHTPWRRYAYGHLAHLDDTPYWHYALQQNLYRHMLHTHYDIELSAMYLVVLHPDYNTYHLIKVPPLDAEVRTILSRLG